MTKPNAANFAALRRSDVIEGYYPRFTEAASAALEGVEPYYFTMLYEGTAADFLGELKLLSIEKTKDALRAAYLVGRLVSYFQGVESERLKAAGNGEIEGNEEAHEAYHRWTKLVEEDVRNGGHLSNAVFESPSNDWGTY